MVRKGIAERDERPAVARGGRLDRRVQLDAHRVAQPLGLGVLDPDAVEVGGLVVVPREVGVLGDEDMARRDGEGADRRGELVEAAGQLRQPLVEDRGAGAGVAGRSLLEAGGQDVGEAEILGAGREDDGVGGAAAGRDRQLRQLRRLLRAARAGERREQAAVPVRARHVVAGRVAVAPDAGADATELHE